MTIQDVCAIIGVVVLVSGALASIAVWLLGIGSKLGGIEKHTESTVAGLTELNKQMGVHSGQLMEHSHKFDELHGHFKELTGHVADIRDDVTDLQHRIPRKA